MGQTTSIQWTNVTWNPVRGCSRVSQGCVNCYAERQAARFAGPGQPFDGFVRIANGHPQWTGKMALVEKHLQDPLHWSKPRRVFVNSMSDLFHESLDVQDLLRVFCVMQEAEQHEFQVLTKRADRMAFLVPWMRQALAEDYERWNGGHFRWPLPNVWLGVSVEDEETANERIPRLLRTPAAIRFVSYEPALGPVDFREFMCDCAVSGMCNGRHVGNYPLPRLDWVIVGGESGPGARPFDIQWATSTIAQCKAAGIACFVKQLGSDPYYQAGANENLLQRVWPHSKQFPEHDGKIRTKLADRKGGDMDEWPEDLRVREFPVTA